jgi:cytochrome-b5 reductase
MRSELDELKKAHPNKFDVWYTIDKSVEPSIIHYFKQKLDTLFLTLIYISDWQYDIGFVNEDMILKHLPPPGDNTMILMCGPPPMINFACQPNLDKLGYSKESRFAY